MNKTRKELIEEFLPNVEKLEKQFKSAENADNENSAYLFITKVAGDVTGSLIGKGAPICAMFYAFLKENPHVLDLIALAIERVKDDEYEEQG